MIRLGASVTVGATVLPKLVSAFRQANLSTDVEVFEDNTEQIQNRLLTDKIDIGLVEGEITSSDIMSKPFMDDELVLICGNQHRFSCLSEINPHELEKENFILRELGSGTRKTFEDVMKAQQLSWKVTWTCNNADTIKAAGDCRTWCFCHIQTRSRKRSCIRPVDNKASCRSPFFKNIQDRLS